MRILPGAFRLGVGVLPRALAEYFQESSIGRFLHSIRPPRYLQFSRVSPRLQWAFSGVRWVKNGWWGFSTCQALSIFPFSRFSARLSLRAGVFLPNSGDDTPLGGLVLQGVPYDTRPLARYPRGVRVLQRVAR